MDKSWIPSVLALPSLGILIYVLKSWREEGKRERDAMSKRIDKLIEERDKLKAEYMTEKNHCQMCQLSSYKIREHVSNIAITLKDDLCEAVDNLKKIVDVIASKITKMETQHEDKA